MSNWGPAACCDDAIHTLESEPGNLAQIIRAFFEDVHTCRTKVLINFQRRGGRNFERSQKAHTVAQNAALGVGFLNVLELSLGDAADLQQFLRLVVKDIQGVRSERTSATFKLPIHFFNFAIWFPFLSFFE